MKNLKKELFELIVKTADDSSSNIREFLFEEEVKEKFPMFKNLISLPDFYRIEFTTGLTTTKIIKQ